MNASPEMRQPIVRASFQAKCGTGPAWSGLPAKEIPISRFAYVHKDDVSEWDIDLSIRESSASFSSAEPEPKMPVIAVK